MEITEHNAAAYEYNPAFSFEEDEIREEKSGLYLVVKRFMDILLSVLGILAVSPLLLLVSVAVKLTSKGPAIFRHKRIGYQGKPIQIYKFRSMVQDAGNLDKYMTAEQSFEYKKNFKLENDPRVTKAGRILRRTSIDELPQLFNILAGDMSFVGPRPIVEEELKNYGAYAQDYLSVKPGLTGMWQVHGRSITTYRERVLLDANYIRNRNLFMDIKLILQTVGVVLTRKGAC